MWIKLNSNKSIIVRGTITHYKAGDWVNVGRQTAEQWILGGEAETVTPEQMDAIAPTSGIVVRGVLPDGWRKKLTDVSGLQLAVTQEWDYSLPFTETLIWTPSFDLRLDLLLKGFDLLKRWQVVVPLYDYETLAANVGTDAEREVTQAVIRDLRVPLRDTRLVYMRRCDATRDLVQWWQKAAETCREERLAFMQALYRVKPIICDVPASWTGRQ